MSVTVNIQGVRQKVSTANLEKATYDLANQMMADMNNFVPMKRGSLRQTAHIEDSGKKIVYRQKYAAYQFYNHFPSNHYTTPGTSGRWDLKASTLFMGSWSRVFVRGLNM